MNRDALRGLTVAVAGAGVVLAAGGAGLAAVGAHQLSHHDGTTALRDQVLGAARQIAVDFASYDYRHLDQDFKRVSAESTGAFRKQFQTSSAGVQSLVLKSKAVSTAEVAGAGVVDAGPTAATVIVAVNRTVTNVKVPKGQNDSFGLQISLLHVDGRWLATNVKPL